MMATTKKTKAFYNTEIPSGWSQKKMADVSKIYDGTHTTPNYIASGVPFYSVEHVTSNNFKDTRFISEEVFAKENERVILEKGDILMTRIGDIGTTKFIDWDVKASFYVSLALIKSNNDYVDPQFLSQFINSNYFQRELYQRTIHVAFPKKINLGEIGECFIALPPISEQKAIARVISTAYAAIHTTEKLIAQKELQKKWLMQLLLTGKIRLKGYGGDWKEEKLKKICKISKGEQLNKTELDKTGKYPSYSGGITPSGYTDEWNTYENTIIISEGGNSCGFVNFITMKFWCGGHCYSLLKLTHSVKKDFLFQFLKFKEPQIMKLRVGSGLPNVQKGDLENFCVKVPPIEEQTAIANVLQAADKEISLLKAKAEKLTEQKKWLMQVLLTGKKRLNINNSGK